MIIAVCRLRHKFSCLGEIEWQIICWVISGSTSWIAEEFFLLKKNKKLWKGSEKSFQQDAQGPKIHYLWFMTMTSFFSSSCIVIIAPLSYNIVALPIDSFEWHFFVLLQSVLAGKRGRGSSCKRRSNVFTLNFSHSQLPKYFHLLLKDLYWILNQIKEALTDIFCGSIRPAGISSSC